MSRTRKRHNAATKAQVLRQHHLEKQPISTVCEAAEVQPSLFYYWQKQLFENAEKAFSEPAPSAREKELEQRIAQLEARLVKKDAVIAQLSEEFIAAKKALGDP